MGKTAITVFGITLVVYLLGLLAGYTASVPYDFIRAILSGELDAITKLQLQWDDWLWIIGTALTAGVAIIYGVTRSVTMEQAIFLFMGAFYASMVLGLVPFYILLAQVHWFFAAVFGIIMLISLAIIIDWIRNPLT